MEGIAKKYKSDLIAIGIICLVILIFFGVSYLKWLHPVVDCGREFYVPLQIMDGRILYKDIYYFYGPFAPYFLSIVFKIFGATLTVGYVIGFIINFLICGVVYYISRQLLSSFKSCLVLLFLVIMVIFTPSLGGYEGTIIPYSFNALLGMLFILLQVAFLLKHFVNKDNSNNLLLLSALFGSLAISCKQECALSALLITLFYTIYLLYNKYNLKNLSIYWFITLVFPVIAYGVFLFIVPFDLYINKSLLPMKIVTNELTQNQVVSFFSVKHSILSAEFFFSTAVMYLSIVLLLFIIIFILTKISKIKIIKTEFSKHKFIFKTIITVISIYIALEVSGIVFAYLPFIFYSINFIRFISWCPIFITIVLIVYLCRYCIRKNVITTEERIFCFIAIAGLLVSLRCYAYCFTGYLLFPLYIVFIYVLLEKIPLLFPEKVVHIVKISFVTSFIIFLVLFASKNIFIYSNMNHLVQTKYGSFKTFEPLAKGFNHAIEYIENNIGENEIITCYPEETMLNFLTRHFSMVMPTEYQAYGTNKEFLAKLGKSDYIIISNYPYIIDAPVYFEESLRNGNKYWYDWLISNYTLVRILGKYSTTQKIPVNDYGMLVFKRNK